MYEGRWRGIPVTMTGDDGTRCCWHLEDYRQEVLSLALRVRDGKFSHYELQTPGVTYDPSGRLVIGFETSAGTPDELKEILDSLGIPNRPHYRKARDVLIKK